MSKTKYKVDFAASVQLYSDANKYMYTIKAAEARRLYREQIAEDMIGSRVIRAMKLKAAPVEPEQAGRSFVPTSQRLSKVGHTHREHLGGKSQKPTVSWQMHSAGKQTRRVQPDPKKPAIEVEVPIYAPREVRDIYLNVLTETLR